MASRASGADIAAGAGLGALLGLMIGLSHSPVVATFVGAVAALLVTLLGLAERKLPGKTPEPASGAQAPEPPELRRSLAQARSVRVASFAFGCLIVTPGALWARTHDWVGLSLAERLQRSQAAWSAAGYAPADVQRFVAFQELGTLPPGALGTPREGKPPPVAEGKGGASPVFSAGALFSEESEAKDACARLREHDFGTSQAALAAFKQQGDSWKRLAEQAEARWKRAPEQSEPARVETLHLVRDLLCDAPS